MDSDRTQPIELDDVPIKVFISSVMSGMEHVRQTVMDAIRAFEITKPWAFEHAPASTLPVKESYLRHVRDCDLFVLVIEGDVTHPVVNEIEMARKHKRPILAFFKRGKLTREAKDVMKGLRERYKDYDDTSDLFDCVRSAVGSELIRKYRMPGPEAIAVAVAADAPEAVVDDPMYAVIGLDDNPMIAALFTAFGGHVVTDRGDTFEPGLEVIGFRSIADLNRVRTGLDRIGAAVSSAPADKRTQAYTDALSDELATTYSSLIVQQQEHDSSDVKDSKPLNPPGFRYMLFMTTPGKALTMRLLDQAHAMLHPEPIQRDAEREYVIMHEGLAALSEAIDGLTSGGDMQSVFKGLMASALRYQLGKVFQP